MESLDSLLLETEEAWQLPHGFHSCLNARGLYSPLQFVLRLRPDLHRLLSSGTTGWVTSTDVSEEKLQAFSTYLHETIHWWQHVGSTTGILLSLLYPTQSHLNHRHLSKLVADGEVWKSLRDYSVSPSTQLDPDSELSRAVNISLNNWHDVEFYRWLITDPRRVEPVIQSPFFLYPAHAYQIAIGGVIWLLSSTLDPELKFLPDPREWNSRAKECEAAQIAGFYDGSPVLLPPIGAREIFEGQARFSQLQYLYFASGLTITWEEFEKAGMFRGVYVDAFNVFIEATGLPRPHDLHDSTVGLFLLVCDIAINPSEGLITDFPEFDRMIEVHDPGRRFLTLCAAIHGHQENFGTCISKYSADEYWAISDALCALTGLVGPRTVMESVASWPSRHERIRDLLSEDSTFRFALANLPVRVFVARFIRFQEDKLKHPEYFCWPGLWMTGVPREGIDVDVRYQLFEEHRALFVDKEDGNVYPRSFEDKDESDVSQTFNTFYAWVAIYELTRQWLVEPGDFDFDFTWLSTQYTQNEIRAWVCDKFKEAFGVHPEEFRIL